MLYICSVKITTAVVEATWRLSHCVMVAQQILVLSVKVRILVGQQTWRGPCSGEVARFFLPVLRYYAQMVELVDTLVSGTSGRTAVQVRVLFWVQGGLIIKWLSDHFFYFIVDSLMEWEQYWDPRFGYVNRCDLYSFLSEKCYICS